MSQVRKRTCRKVCLKHITPTYSGSVCVTPGLEAVLQICALDKHKFARCTISLAWSSKMVQTKQRLMGQHKN